MNRLDRRQRYALVTLVVANLVVFGAILLFFLLSTSESNSTSVAPILNPGYEQACRDAASAALLNAGHSGLVHIQKDGSIFIQLQPTSIAENPRFDVDAAVWAAFEAIADSGACVESSTAYVTVILSLADDNSGLSGSRCSEQPDGPITSTTECGRLEATARVNVSDVMLWSLGKIDDAQLALRVDYHPSATPLAAPH
jgi:hypothetical protein